MTKWKVTLTLDDGGWMAKVHDIPDGSLCVTQGRTTEEARLRVREALATALERDLTANDVLVFEEDFG